MRHWIHYLAAAAWGLATPVLMGESVEEIMEEFPIGAAAAPRMGHPTPVEFFLLLAIVGVLAMVLLLLSFGNAELFTRFMMTDPTPSFPVYDSPPASACGSA